MIRLARYLHGDYEEEMHIEWADGTRVTVPAQSAFRASFRKYATGVFLGGEFADAVSVTAEDGRKFDGCTDDPAVIALTEQFVNAVTDGTFQGGKVIYSAEEGEQA